MNPIEALQTRASVGRTTEPAPDGEDLEQILRAGVRAPDHKSLRPWRFIVVRGEARSRLGEVFAEALAGRQPDSTAEALDRERAKTGRAPLLVVVVMRTDDGVPGVPPVEQVLSTGAAAQNILVAAHALGFGGMWRTGEAAYDRHVQQALGLGAGETIAGFLYLGTAPAAPPVRARTEPGPYVSEWTGP